MSHCVLIAYGLLCDNSIQVTKNWETFSILISYHMDSPQYVPENCKIPCALLDFLQTRMVNRHWYFACQHGPRECFGNKMQACSLQQNVTQAVHLKFINCVMSNPDPASEQGGEDVRIFNTCNGDRTNCFF